MSTLRILGMVALFMIGGELPVFAQAAIQEPGNFAFFHPNADVLNGGRPVSPTFGSMSAFASDRGVRSDAYALGRFRRRHGDVANRRSHW